MNTLSAQIAARNRPLPRIRASIAAARGARSLMTTEAHLPGAAMNV